MCMCVTSSKGRRWATCSRWRHHETIKSAAQTLPPFFYPFHHTSWIPRPAFRLDSSCPQRATCAYMATVTSRTGTATRRLFSAVTCRIQGQQPPPPPPPPAFVWRSPDCWWWFPWLAFGFATQEKCHLARESGIGRSAVLRTHSLPLAQGPPIIVYCGEFSRVHACVCVYMCVRLCN